MIRLENISKEYSSGKLFNGVSLLINSGMRIGLIGQNGSGKTTLFRLILGYENPDSGTIQKNKNLSIGYLPQEIIMGTRRSVLEELFSSIPEIQNLEDQMKRTSIDIAKTPNDQSKLKTLGRLQEKFENLGGWTIKNKAKAILGGLGFTENQFDEPMETFSGGWRMRVALAGILLKKPDVLFLDEPTNHLDLDATIWLEHFLAEWKGSLIMISHDREFLNQSVNNVMEINQSKVIFYKGNYDSYLKQKQLRIEQQYAEWSNQQDMIIQTKRFIERFRYKNTKARQVQSKIKHLEKLVLIDEPIQQNKHIKIKIPKIGRSPLKIVRLINVDKQYDSKSVYKGLNLEIERGNRIGLVGPNGVGKSTLLKMLAGVEQITSGRLIYGEGVTTAYFAQHQMDTLNPDATVLQNLQDVAPSKNESELRNHLGSFLFPGDAISKLVKVLSGGEKSRLALAKMLICPAHLLLLDEPTNHLDIVSRDIVLAALKNYNGTIVCISHDRYFLNAITNYTFEIGKGRVVIYSGNYDYYVWKSQGNKTQLESLVIKKNRTNNKKIKYKKKKRQVNRQKVLVRKIKEIEKELDNLKVELLNPEIASDYEKIQSLLECEKEYEEKYFAYLIELEELQL